MLIAWEHYAIYDAHPTTGTGPVGFVARLPVNNADALPSVWPDDRFDLIWLFTLDHTTGTYTFTQHAELLLADDSDELLAAG